MIDLVAFPFHDWHKGQREGFRTRDGHLMQEFGRHEDVARLIVVNRPRSRIERLLRGSRSGAGPPLFAIRGRIGFKSSVCQVATKTYTIDTDVPDILGPVVSPRGWWFDVFANREVIEMISRSLMRLDAQESPIIAWVPTVAPALRALHPTRLVFDSLDNWLIHPILRREAQRARAAYQEILSFADEVFVAAPASERILRQWRSDLTVLANGVDPEHFDVNTARPGDLPAGPVVGYAGKIAHRIDSALIRDVAGRMPALHFVFVGPVMEKQAIRGLRRLANVHFLGDKPYAELPKYLNHFDVAWIPHRVGEGETGGDPIKLYEYWAARRPVVSTRIDGMERWEGVLSLINTADDAEAAILTMLAKPVVPEIPADRTWSWIAARLLRPLTRPLAPPNATSGDE